MALNIQIAVETAGAIPAIKGVTSELGAAEHAGKKVGDAIDEGLQRGIRRSEEAKRAMEELRRELEAGPSGNRASRLEQEAEMYERIKGPIRDYAQSLRALDNLLDKDAISTREYADQVRRLNQELERKRPGDQEGPAQRPTGGGGGGDMIAMAGELAAAAAVVVAVVHVGDAYTELTNPVQRFATAQHSADDIVRDELNLAGQLHASLAETSSLYFKLRASTSDVNMTYAQSIEMTRTLGEVAVLSGHSVGDASAMIAKLSYAMETGTLTGRELKSMMREYPALADLWTSSLGKTRSELMDMANHGKLSMKQLTDAFVDAGAIHEQFGKRVETVGEQWQHFKDEMVVGLGKIAEESHAIDIVRAGFEDLMGQIKPVVEGLGAVASGLHAVGDAASWLKGGGSGGGSSALSWLNPMKAVNQLWKPDTEQANPQMQQFFGLDDKSGQIAASAAAAQEEMDLLKKGAIETGEIWADSSAKIFHRFDQALGMMADASKSTAADMLRWWVGALGNMDDLIGQGLRKVGVDDPWAHFKKSPKGMSESEKIYQEATQGAINWQREMTALNRLFDEGKLTARQYAEELTRINARSPDHSFEAQLKRDIVAYDEATRAAQRYTLEREHGITSPGSVGLTGPNFSQSERDAATDLAAQQAGERYGDAAQASQEKLHAKLLDLAADGAQKFREQMLELNTAEQQGVITGREHGEILAALRNEMTIGVTPAEEWAKKLKEASALYGAGASTAQHYKQAIAELAAKYDQSMDQGVINGMKAVSDQIKDMASSTSNAITSMWSSLNDNLAKQIVDGKADWSSFMHQIEIDSTKLALQAGEKSILDAVKGAAGSSSAAASITSAGTTVGSGWISAITGAGAQVAAEWRAAMSGGPRGGAGLGSIAGSSAGTGAADAGVAPIDAEPLDAGATAMMGRRSGGSSSAPVKVITVVDMRAAALEAMRSDEGQQVVIHHVTSNKRKLRIGK